MKECTDCHEVKPVEDFPIDRYAPSGHKSYCKSCNRLRVRRYKDKIKSSVKIIQDEKSCANCQQVKPGDEFHRRNDSADGLSPYCKTCTHDVFYQRTVSGLKSEVNDKYCGGCGRLLPASSFGKNRGKPDGLQTQCKDCFAKWRSNNPDKISDQNKKYWQENKDRLTEYNRQYYLSNRERLIEYAKEWFQAFKGTPEYKAYQRRKNSVRRARTLVSNNDLTYTQISQMYALQDGRCASCGCEMEPNGRNGSSITVDHIVPLSMGGGLTVRNTQLLCFSCNSSKNATIADYRDWVPEGDRITSQEDLDQPSSFWENITLLK